jgi:uncharacterized protein (TIGR03435 family)
MRAKYCRLAVFAAGLLAGQTKPHFDVASVKPSTAPVGSPGQYVFSAGRVTLANDSPAFLVAAAWNVREDNVFGLPTWAKTSTFLIDARAGSRATQKEMQPMLQSLLEERFRLKFHRETRQMDVYILTRSGNTKLHPAASQTCVPDGTSLPPFLPNRPIACGRVNLSMSPGGEARVRGGQVSAEGLAAFLGSFWHRKVINRSELTGVFNVDLSFTVDMDQPGSPTLQPAQSNGPGVPAPPGPPRFTFIPQGLNKSLNEQLGLKLQPSKGPVEVIVVDHVERPTPN